MSQVGPAKKNLENENFSEKQSINITDAEFIVGNISAKVGDELALATRTNNFKKISEICSAVDEPLRDSSGHTALHWAALGKPSSTLQTILNLTRHSVDVRSEASDQYGQTPLHWALVSGSTENVSMLLEAGASPARSDARGYTSLIHCAQYGRVDLAHLLLTADSTLINLADREGRTALHWAAHGGHFQLVSYFLRVASPSADVSKRDSSGQTALHKACSRKHTLVIRALLECGAAYNATDKDNQMPRDYIPRLRGAQSAFAEVRRAERGEHTGPPRTRLRSYSLVFFYYSILILTYWYYDRYVEGLEQRASAYSKALRLFCLLALVAHASATYGDPGDVPKGTPEDCRAFIENAIAKNEGDIALTTSRYCFSCLRPRVPRSKHSRSRAVCVRRFDHECPWTNNAVGLRNHRVLLMFAAAMLTSQVLFLNQLRVFLRNDNAIKFWWQIFTLRPLAIILFALHCVLATFCSVLLLQHLVLAAWGLTTYERIAFKRANKRNPYDMGWARNLWLFVTATGPGTEESENKSNDYDHPLLLNSVKTEPNA